MRVGKYALGKSRNQQPSVAMSIEGEMGVLGFRCDRYTSLHSQLPVFPLQLDQCNVHELLELRQCCESVSRMISERLALRSEPRSGQHHRKPPNVEPPLLSSLILMSEKQSGTEEAAKESKPNHSRNAHIPNKEGSEMGLWEAIPQPLFSGKKLSTVRAELASEEDPYRPPSPVPLSVKTDGSDGGIGGSVRAFLESGHGNSDIVRTNRSAPPTINAYANTTMYSTEPSRSSPSSPHDPSSPRETDSQQQGRRKLALGTHGPVTPIPECNSSLETHESNELAHHSSQVRKSSQSLCNYSSTFESLAERSTSELDVTAVPPSQTNISQPKPPAVNLGYKKLMFNEDVNKQQPVKSSEQLESTQKRGVHNFAPMVQYGFQSPNITRIRTTGCCGQSEVSNECVSQSESARSTPGHTRYPRYSLLSASLSQCASNASSPIKSGHIDSLAYKLSCISPAASRDNYGTSSFYCGDEWDGNRSNHYDVKSGTQSSGTATLNLIPDVLQTEMMTMGFHRPSRVRQG